MSYSIEMPVHASPAQLRVAAEFFSKLADVRMQEEAEFEEVVHVTNNVANTTQEATSRSIPISEMNNYTPATISQAFEQAEAYPQGVVETIGQLEERQRMENVVPAVDASAVFGGAAAPAPLPEPSATAAPVPAPSGTIPEPSSAPAAAVPGPVITDAAAAIGLPSPTPATSGPALDKEGLPWDHRIHAESKAQNQDGTWRKKRGVTDEEFARVKGEMKAMLGGSQVPGPTAASGVTAPPAPVATPTPPAPAGDSGYGAMMLWLNGPMTSQPQKLTMSDLNAAIGNCAPIFGIEPPAGGFNISTIKLAPAPLIAMIRAELGTLAASRGWVDEVAG